LPTFVTHAVTGLCAGKTVFLKKLPVRFWVLSMVLPAVPDLDVIGLALGIPYAHFFGHRGFFHSPFFALLLGIAATAIWFREEKIFSRRWWQLTVYFFLITASHGILDAFTSGGLGIALLSPFSNQRFFAPWTPIQVSPIGFRSFFSTWGLNVIASEFLWVWLPSFTIVFISIFLRARARARARESNG
jgi:inner membrane protein